MGTKYLIKLRCRAGTQFHLGESTPFEDSVLHKSSEIIHSDTLFSALVCIAAKIGVTNPEKVLGEGRISSCFYMMEKDNTNIFFLPRPTTPLFGEMPFKLIKKIKYVSLGVFNSEIPVYSWFNVKHFNKVHEDLIVGNNWIATKKEFEAMNIKSDDAKKLQLYQLQTLPQVRVHTNENKNNLYQVERLQIYDNSQVDGALTIGFYFLFEGELSNNLKMVIHLLQDEGLGGQRSIGFGLFSEIKIVSNIKIFDLNGNKHMNISLFSPNDNDFNELRNCYYQTILRGGRNLATKYYLKQLLMIKEGAIISGTMQGHVADISVQKDNPNLRYGKSFPLTIPNIMQI
ncbi:MAG: type III-A CRISPR-associated RAMP protein Csm4 [Prevotellaceae bacterium]|jgi:CRISPR-associated protein Csm4|nr:type III-A CRISPR-associated RAMP protein Csm4 [Prevotellaceae bacterium]